MYEEYKSRGYKGVFFTLTYNDASVPKNYLYNGVIYRSKPDYHFTNLRKDDSGALVAPPHAHKKYSEPVWSVLDFFGVPHDEIVDFNEKSPLYRQRKWKESLFDKVKQYISDSLPEETDVDEVEILEDLDDNFGDMPSPSDITWSYHIDEDTGELTDKLDDDGHFTSCPKEEVASDSRLVDLPLISFNSVRCEDVQAWLKRCKMREKRSGRIDKISYFITSEYGPTTLRPHYHGIVFGLDKDEFAHWMKDWKEHYGEICSYDNLDMSKGGLSYVSKYCSKGFFEHPLCAKDFFYFRNQSEGDFKRLLCSEYHSKHYERCIEWFGIDAPIVDKTFHLVSKGFGVDWIERSGMGERCKEFDSIKDFYCPIDSVYDMDCLLDGSLSVQEVLKNECKYHDIVNSYENRRTSKTEWLERFDKRFKYTRVFRHKSVNAQGQTSFSEESFDYSVPNYYRTKMFSDNLRHSYSLFLRSVNDELYREKLEQLRASDFFRTDAERVSWLEDQERLEVVQRFRKAFQNSKKFLKKSQL